MSEITKKDFIYFQNEVLEDMKKIESKFLAKINQINTYIQEITTANENNYLKLKNSIQQLSSNNQGNNQNEKNILDQIELLKKRIEEERMNTNSKINVIQKDISNAFYKYDTIIMDNLKVNGLVGDGCKFTNLKFFIEYINRRTQELVLSKDKITSEMGSLKERTNDLINQVRLGLDNERTYTNKILSKKMEESEKQCLERNNTIADKIQELRMDNCKYINELLEKTNETKLEWEKLQNIKNEILEKFDEEKNISIKNTETILNSFNSLKDEFDLIKSRFIEVRDLVKHIRFMRNYNEIISKEGNKDSDKKGSKDFKTIAKKLNFNKMQKIGKEDREKLNKEELYLKVVEKSNSSSKDDLDNKKLQSFSPDVKYNNRKNIYKIKNMKRNVKVDINAKKREPSDNYDLDDGDTNKFYFDDTTYNMDALNGTTNTDDYSSNDFYKDIDKIEKRYIEELYNHNNNNNYMTPRNELNSSNKYSKIKIKSVNLHKNNNNEGSKILNKKLNFIQKEKNPFNFTSDNNKTNNLNEIINNDTNKEKECQSPDNTISNNTIKNKIENISEVEKQLDNKNMLPNINEQTQTKSYNIISINGKMYNLNAKDIKNNNFINNSNNTINHNIKYIFKKIMNYIKLVNHKLNKKHNRLSNNIYNIFTSIKVDVNQIYNEINKIYAYYFNHFIKMSPYDLLINSIDLFNSSGIKLKMNNKKNEERDFHSSFSANKCTQKNFFDEIHESPKNILNNVEPYLIKKFKQNQKK